MTRSLQLLSKTYFSCLIEDEPVVHAKYTNGMVAMLSEQALKVGEAGLDLFPFNIVSRSAAQTPPMPAAVGKAWTKSFMKELSRIF